MPTPTPDTREDRPPQPFVRAGGAPGLVRHTGARVHVLVRAADTDGAWGMLDHAIPPRAEGAPPHRHRATTEVLYGVEGEVVLTLDGRDVRLLRGDAAVVPPGVVHAYRNRSDAPAAVLLLYMPGGLERHAEVLAALAGSSERWPPDAAALAEAAAPFDLLAPP
ncbi:cupin domain-containing protein [Roseisolibacter sp. H3M3-2]|uniref:cupin domain-containing protein n=1 Tax=Roseisolibacter sp. H3M3-2 TaxID=3031323 RepID=UPI0023DAAE2F|nr:cupin domain-containing protein [Roseisolibacter sp. H3M3-2]MDF1505851.1 cupin domain-containing protein [Roseisolibacter sp. H3M3-2]